MYIQVTYLLFGRLRREFSMMDHGCCVLMYYDRHFSDSGIQSVGDSIRGSSDSMTNGGSAGVGGVNNLGGTNNSLAASTASTASTRSASSNNMTDYPSNICKDEQDPSEALLEKKTNKAPVLCGATVQKCSATAAWEAAASEGEC